MELVPRRATIEALGQGRRAVFDEDDWPTDIDAATRTVSHLRFLPGDIVSVHMPLSKGLDRYGELNSETLHVRDEPTTLGIILYAGPTKSIHGSYHVIVFGSFGVGWAWNRWCIRVG